LGLLSTPIENKAKSSKIKFVGKTKLGTFLQHPAKSSFITIFCGG